MTKLSALLSTYASVQQQRTSDITNQLKRLQQQLVSQMLTIQERDREFIATQESLLAQIRPLLATDARSLLVTSEFRSFVQSLAETMNVSAIQTGLSLQISSDPRNWHLAALPTPLQLQNIEEVTVAIDDGEAVDCDRGIRVQVELGTFQQLILIPTDTSQQWGQVACQIQETMLDFPIKPDLQFGLAQELICLLAYIGTLFWVNRDIGQFEKFQFNLRTNL